MIEYFITELPLNTIWEKDMIHSVLLIGQSNMAGRGRLSDVEPIRNPRIKVLRNGRWQNMYVPVNCDRPFSGVCLAESFADEYAREHGVDVGLIPCADGGTSLRQWREGGLLYDHAVMQARLASRTSTIVAVLWHQGEADCAPELNETYAERAIKIFEALRRDADLGDVPFILGGLGDFLKERTESPNLYHYERVNEQLRSIVSSYPLFGYADASGLTDNGDKLHFNAPSLREFGVRYYGEFKKLEKKDRVFLEKSAPDDAVRTEMEAL